MKLVIQRVISASVKVEGRTVGAISTGLLILVGISRTDTPETLEWGADKVLGLRIFNDDADKMNRSVVDVGGSLLVVSQFTLYGDCSRGRRPGFDAAAPPAEAQALYNHFVEYLKRGPVPVETGIFQASMDVSLVNQGPVTLLLDSAERTKK